MTPMKFPGLPSWTLPAGLLLLAVAAVVMAGKVTERWLLENQQAERVDGLTRELTTNQLALQATGAALTSEKVARQHLASALEEERLAQLEAERRHQAMSAAYTDLLAKQEQLEHENPDVKAWADQPVPAGVSRLLSDARAHYRDQDRDGGADAAPGQPAAHPAAGAQPPD